MTASRRMSPAVSATRNEPVDRFRLVAHGTADAHLDERQPSAALPVEEGAATDLERTIDLNGRIRAAGRALEITLRRLRRQRARLEFLCHDAIASDSESGNSS